jgi:hypothetical protein
MALTDGWDLDLEYGDVTSDGMLRYLSFKRLAED